MENRLKQMEEKTTKLKEENGRKKNKTKRS